MFLQWGHSLPTGRPVSQSPRTTWRCSRMALPRPSYFLIALAFTSVAATHKTPNFTVNAPNEEVAKQVGQLAEKYRKEKAMEWLGKEMPQWGQPCPLKVKVTGGGPGGAT